MTKTKEIEEVEFDEATPEQVEVSKEELAQRRKEITDYYKDNIKHLKIQLEYEELLMNIEKTRAERIQAQMFLAQATMGGEQGQNNEEAAAAFAESQKGHAQESPFDPEPKRVLKRTE
tara:strand:+ start:1453 stop:1806 length:354 start_codon:yes stop_codon:yes gene_type:complete